MDVEKLFKPAFVEAQKPIHGGGDVWHYFSGTCLDFSSTVGPLGPSKKVLEAIAKESWKIAYYPDSDSESLRKTLSLFLKVNIENILVGNGSTELIKNFCESFLLPEDKVLVLAPTYSDYALFAKFYTKNISYFYAKAENNFEFDVPLLLKELDKKMKCIFLCNPNNPTGILLPKTQLIKILEKAAAVGTLVFLDEAYVDFAEAESLASEIEEYDNLFILRSFTKFFCIPGIRIGCAITSKKLADYIDKCRMPWNVNILAHVAAQAAITDKEYITDEYSLVMKERQFLFSELSKFDGFRVFPSDVNFFLVSTHKCKITARQLREFLLARQIIIRDCSTFNGLDEYYFRVCTRKHEDIIRLITALKEAVAHLSR